MKLYQRDRLVGGITAAAIMGTVIVGGAWLVSSTPSTESAASESVEVIDLATIPDGVNGLAAEQEAEAAALVEAQRVAAEHAAAEEAARVAAEQAAAAEAERLAAEQAAAESYEEPVVEEPPATDPVPEGAWPLPWIESPDPINAPGGGRWDMSNCFGHGETINGVNYCIP